MTHTDHTSTSSLYCCGTEGCSFESIQKANYNRHLKAKGHVYLSILSAPWSRLLISATFSWREPNLHFVALVNSLVQAEKAYLSTGQRGEGPESVVRAATLASPPGPGSRSIAQGAVEDNGTNCVFPSNEYIYEDIPQGLLRELEEFRSSTNDEHDNPGEIFLFSYITSYN